VFGRDEFWNKFPKLSRVKQCIGERNYKWFLAFILSHCLLCFYATYIGFWVFYGRMVDDKLLEVNYYIAGKQQPVKGSIFIALQVYFFQLDLTQHFMSIYSTNIRHFSLL